MINEITDLIREQLKGSYTIRIDSFEGIIRLKIQNGGVDMPLGMSLLQRIFSFLEEKGCHCLIYDNEITVWCYESL